MVTRSRPTAERRSPRRRGAVVLDELELERDWERYLLLLGLSSALLAALRLLA